MATEYGAGEGRDRCPRGEVSPERLEARGAGASRGVRWLILWFRCELEGGTWDRALVSWPSNELVLAGCQVGWLAVGVEVVGRHWIALLTPRLCEGLEELAVAGSGQVARVGHRRGESRAKAREAVPAASRSVARLLIGVGGVGWPLLVTR